LLRNSWRGFVSATLPDGKVLDEPAIRALVAGASVNRELPGRSSGDGQSAYWRAAEDDA
jgi:hypothetical protein